VEESSPSEEELAKLVLSREIDDEEAGARVTELLDGIPGAHARARLGLEQGRSGETIPVDEL